MGNIRFSAPTAAAIAAVLALIVYVPSLGNGFALDDTRDIVENPAVHGLANTGEILTSPYRGRVPAGRSPYRPMTSLTYALSWSMGSGSPVPFHAFNVVLHVVNSALVTIFLTTLGAVPLLALFGGAIFAVHPVHVEAIANSVGRGDALMALFVLLGALAYLRSFRSQWARIGLISLAYALALASKENGVVLPALLVVLSLLFAGRSEEMREEEKEEKDEEDVVATEAEEVEEDAETELEEAFHGAPALKSQLALFGALAGVLALYFGVRYQVLGTLFHRDAAPYIVTLTAPLRLSTAVANITELTRLLLFPVDLVADYGPGVILPTGIGELRFWVGVGILLVAGALTVFSLRRSPWIAVGVLWGALSLAVVSNILFPVGIWIAERTLYLPSVGLSLLGVGVLQYAIAWGRESPARVRWSVVGALMLLVAVGGARTWTRSLAWYDTETVFMTLANEHPESFRAQWWMGVRLIEAQEITRGLEWLEQAVDLNPNELRLQLEYGRGLLLAGRPEEALALVSALPPADPARDVYLTQSHIQLDQPERAREAVRAGLSRFPQDARLIRQARELEENPPENR